MTNKFIKGLSIGNIHFKNNLFLAPMAGYTDVPFRNICRLMGASYGPGEMVASKSHLWNTSKSKDRFRCKEEPSPRGVQLIGENINSLVEAARYAVSQGAEIIDLNCGCPVRKVCSVECGSALLKEPRKVFTILSHLVEEVPVPITLKYRLGWDDQSINAVEVAQLAEQAGVKLLCLHGRTREQKFTGKVNLGEIKRVKQAVSIPVVANGDIDCPEKAKKVFEATGVDGLMIGRASLGQPWIFQEILQQLSLSQPDPIEYELKIKCLLEHVNSHFLFYEPHKAIQTIRKHLSCYVKRLDLDAKFLEILFQIEDPTHFVSTLSRFFNDNGIHFSNTLLPRGTR